MALLRVISALGALALAGCYTPELRDCAVTCGANVDCAPGQVCGTDGMCASPSLAGRCPTHAAPGVDAALAFDAALGADAAVAIDAALPPPDAPMPSTVQLRIKIAGRGRVNIEGTSLSCPNTAPMATCTFDVAPGMATTLIAVPGQDSHFEKWESVICAGQDESCVMTTVAPLTSVEAKFKNGD